MNKISPPTLMLFCLLGMIALAWFFPFVSFTTWGLFIPGVGLIALGIVMAFGAEVQFRKKRTTVNYLGMPATLVTDGWFSFSRNPMYLSFAMTLMGAWLMLGALSPLFAVLAYLALTERWYILPEEEKLNAAFGQEYESYRLRTRRWL